MRIAVIGSGYVGTTAAAIFANAGHKVMALDVDPKKVDKINDGKAPFYEVGLNELLATAIKSEQLSATTDYQQALEDVDVVVLRGWYPRQA